MQKRVGELKAQLAKLIAPASQKAPAVTAKHNIESFPAEEARFVALNARSSGSRRALMS